MRPLFSSLLLSLFVLPFSASAAELETQAQKLSYIIGMDIGSSLQRQGTEIDLEALFDAIETTYSGGEAALSPEEAASIREAFVAERRAAAESEREEIGAENAAKGAAFLAENRNAQGVVVTESGLQYKVLTEGDGPMPSATDRVTVHYRGTLIDGTEFDSSYARGEPIAFALNQVIPGWTEGVQLMAVGSHYQFFIPSDLAYGTSGGGSIGPNETLIFEVELLGIE